MVSFTHALSLSPTYLFALGAATTVVIAPKDVTA
jgi:hypothetical protein